MVFFLDLLHEDLNKVSVKPLTPSISYDSRPDDVSHVLLILFIFVKVFAMGT